MVSFLILFSISCGLYDACANAEKGNSNDGLSVNRLFPETSANVKNETFPEKDVEDFPDIKTNVFDVSLGKPENLTEAERQGQNDINSFYNFLVPIKRIARLKVSHQEHGTENPISSRQLPNFAQEGSNNFNKDFLWNKRFPGSLLNWEDEAKNAQNQNNNNYWPGLRQKPQREKKVQAKNSSVDRADAKTNVFNIYSPKGGVNIFPDFRNPLAYNIMSNPQVPLPEGAEKKSFWDPSQFDLREPKYPSNSASNVFNFMNPFRGNMLNIPTNYGNSTNNLTRNSYDEMSDPFSPGIANDDQIIAPRQLGNFSEVTELSNDTLTNLETLMKSIFGGFIPLGTNESYIQTLQTTTDRLNAILGSIGTAELKLPNKVDKHLKDLVKSVTNSKTFQSALKVANFTKDFISSPSWTGLTNILDALSNTTYQKTNPRKRIKLSKIGELSSDTLTKLESLTKSIFSGFIPVGKNESYIKKLQSATDHLKSILGNIAKVELKFPSEVDENLEDLVKDVTDSKTFQSVLKVGNFTKDFISNPSWTSLINILEALSNTDHENAALRKRDELSRTGHPYTWDTLMKLLILEISMLKNESYFELLESLYIFLNNIVAGIAVSVFTFPSKVDENLKDLLKNVSSETLQSALKVGNFKDFLSNPSWTSLITILDTLSNADLEKTSLRKSDELSKIGELSSDTFMKLENLTNSIFNRFIPLAKNESYINKLQSFTDYLNSVLGNIGTATLKFPSKVDENLKDLVKNFTNSKTFQSALKVGNFTKDLISNPSWTGLEKILDALSNTAYQNTNLRKSIKLSKIGELSRSTLAKLENLTKSIFRGFIAVAKNESYIDKLQSVTDRLNTILGSIGTAELKFPSKVDKHLKDLVNNVTNSKAFQSALKVANFTKNFISNPSWTGLTNILDALTNTTHQNTNLRKRAKFSKIGTLSNDTLTKLENLTKSIVSGFIPVAKNESYIKKLQTVANHLKNILGNIGTAELKFQSKVHKKLNDLLKNITNSKGYQRGLKFGNFTKKLLLPLLKAGSNIFDTAHSIFKNKTNRGTFSKTKRAGTIPLLPIFNNNVSLSSYDFGNVAGQTDSLGQIGNFANIGNLFKPSITYPSSERIFGNASNGGSYTITTNVGNSTKNLINAYLPYLFGRGFGNVTKQTINLGQLGNFANLGNLFNQPIYPSSETNANVYNLFGNASNRGTYAITTDVGNLTKNLINSAYLPYLFGRGFGNITGQNINLGQLGSFANIGNLFNQSVIYPSSETNANVYNLFGNASNGGTYAITTDVGNLTKNLINSAYLPYLFGRVFGNVTNQFTNLGQLGNFPNNGNMFNQSIAYPSEINGNIYNLLGNITNGGTYTSTTHVGNSTKNVIDSAYLPFFFGRVFGNATNQIPSLGQVVDLTKIQQPSFDNFVPNDKNAGDAIKLKNFLKQFISSAPQTSNGGTYTITTDVGNLTKNLINSAYLPYLFGRVFGNVTKQTINLGQLGNFANPGNLLNLSITYPSSETNANVYNLFGNASNGGTYTITTDVGNLTKNPINSAYLPYLFGRGFGNVTNQFTNVGQLGNFPNIGIMFNQSIAYPSEINGNIYNFLGNITNGGTYTSTTNVGNFTRNVTDSAYLPFFFGSVFGNVTNQIPSVGQSVDFTKIQQPPFNNFVPNDKNASETIKLKDFLKQFISSVPQTSKTDYIPFSRYKREADSGYNWGSLFDAEGDSTATPETTPSPTTTTTPSTNTTATTTTIATTTTTTTTATLPTSAPTHHNPPEEGCHGGLIKCTLRYIFKIISKIFG